MTKEISASAAAPDLGPVLYGENMHNTPAVIYTSLGAVFLALGLLVALIPPDPKMPPDRMLIGGLIVAAFGAVILVIGLVRLIPNLGSSWHLHERGLRLIRRRNEISLRYEDVDELTLKTVRVFFHDVCTGDVHDATFQSHSPIQKTIFIKQVRRPSTVSGVDLDQPGEMTLACDKVARFIAQRMARKLAGGESIAWVKSIRIHADGLEVESSGVTQGPIPWRQIERTELEEGTFHLWRRGDSKPIVKTPTHAANFFPGHRLILDRIAAVQKPATDAD